MALAPLVDDGGDLERQDFGSLSGHGRGTQLFILLFRVLRMFRHPCARARMVPVEQRAKRVISRSGRPRIAPWAGCDFY